MSAPTKSRSMSGLTDARDVDQRILDFASVLTECVELTERAMRDTVAGSFRRLAPSTSAVASLALQTLRQYGRNSLTRSVSTSPRPQPDVHLSAARR